MPVVASDIRGNRELVVHGETGYLVPIGDRAGFARFAHKILDDPALAARLGAAGSSESAQNSRSRRWSTKHAAVYRELLD